MSLDPGQSAGRFSRPGVAWFVKKLFLDGRPEQPDDVLRTIEEYGEAADELVRASPLLADIDIDTDDGSTAAVQILEQHPDTPERWAMVAGSFCLIAKEAVEAGDTPKAAWAMASLQQARSMLVFAQFLEPLVWQGYNVQGYAKLTSAARTWNEEQANSNEEFWHQFFVDNMAVLSQALYVPVVLYKDKAYVGGKSVDNTGAKYTDFLVKNSISGMAAVVEIKTPTTALLGTEYRAGVYAPSSTLSGSIMQVLNQRETMTREYHLRKSTNPEWEAVDPVGVVLIGNAGQQLDTRERRESFELFRRNLRNTQVLTFDELFARLRLVLDALSAFAAGAS